MDVISVIRSILFRNHRRKNEEKQMKETTQKKPEVLTDEQVEIEIERLKESPLVKLAKKEERIRYRRRQYLYKLRGYERKGRELKEAGITMEMLDAIEMDDDEM